MKKPFDYESVGLSVREKRVYEALLEADGVASIRSIASSSGLNRGVVFESIKKLSQVGLIGNNLKGKQKRYFANSPNVLKGLWRLRQDELKRTGEVLDDYINSLHARGRASVPPQFAAMYEGEEEIAALLRDVLATVSHQDNKSYSIISAADIRDYLYRRFANFTRQRIKMGLSVRSIGTVTSGQPAELSERRLLDGAGLKAPSCYVIIYGDKVAQISLHEDLVPYGLVINNHELAKLQQLMFDNLWQSLPPLEENNEGQR